MRRARLPVAPLSLRPRMQLLQRPWLQSPTSLREVSSELWCLTPETNMIF